MVCFYKLRMYVYLQVIIEAKRGVSYKGDIAIDDLEFYDGDCHSSGKRSCLSLQLFHEINA